MNAAGRMSDDRRNEGQLLCDILGLESLIDEITYKLADEAADEPTATAILGPFWRKDAPLKEMGDTIVSGIDEEGHRTWMHGVVTDFKTGEPVEGAVLDVWHTAPNGLYEQQDPDQPDMNLRGRFTTGKDGTYNFYCLRPVPYPIPYDGPAGKILQALDRHPYRPAHIHFIVSDNDTYRAPFNFLTDGSNSDHCPRLQTHRNPDLRSQQQVHRRRRRVRRQGLAQGRLQADPKRSKS